MTEQDKKPVAATRPASPPANKDVPAAAPAQAVAETAPSARAAQPATKSAAAKAATVKSTTPAAARPPRVRKPTEVEQTVAKHRKVLAEELAKAQAISYEKPKVMQPPAAPKKAPKKAAKAAERTGGKPAEKPAKAKKPRLVRDSYAMPEIEYAQISLLKKRLAALGREVKKSELLRGGIAALAAFNDDELKAVMGRIERIKTGRPAKK